MEVDLGTLFSSLWKHTQILTGAGADSSRAYLHESWVILHNEYGLHGKTPFFGIFLSKFQGLIQGHVVILVLIGTSFVVHRVITCFSAFTRGKLQRRSYTWSESKAMKETISPEANKAEKSEPWEKIAHRPTFQLYASETNILRSCGMYEIFQKFICLKIYISGKNI